MPKPTSRSIVFDTKLLGMGSWKEDVKKLVDDWISEDEFDEKRALGSNLIQKMIVKMLGEDCSETGLIRARRLGETLQHFEDLLAITRGGIAKKFYRDHLNHMLRVMLLANAIGDKIKSLSSTRENARMLTIAALVHDIAYPLAESYGIIDETTKAMKRCYGALSFPDYKISYDHKKAEKILAILASRDAPTSLFKPLIKEHNHGLMGCIEFIDYIKEKDLTKNKPLLQAIAFHDPVVMIPKSLRSDPILLALVLSDELQDWGRPVGLDKEPAISNIEDFSIDSHGVTGAFKWRTGVAVSPLRQIYSKILNFSRFKWPKMMKVALLFRLPDYETFFSQEFEENCREMLSYCEESHPEYIQDLNRFWNNSKEYFRTFYGGNLPVTKNLVDCWKGMTYQAKESIDVNSIGREILHTEKTIGKILSLQIEIHGTNVTTLLFGDKGRLKGVLNNHEHQRTLGYAQKLTLSIMIFHGLAVRIAAQGNVGLLSRFTFPSKKLIMKAMKTIGCKDWTDDMTDGVSVLRKCIVEQGFFSFQSAKN